jgi:hypothetical protein
LIDLLSLNPSTDNQQQSNKMNILDKIIEEKRRNCSSKSKISVEQLKDSEFLEEKLFR